MSKFILSEQEREKIFNERIAPSFLANAVSNEHPIAIIFGGQPGSGKSSLIRMIKEIKTDFSVINGDDLRGYHPNMYEFLRQDEKNASDLVQPDCNFWIEKLIDLAAKNKANIIIEGTMRRPAVPLVTAQMLKKEGYQVEAYVVVVPPEISLASIFYRYELQKKMVGYGRFVKPQNHGEAFSGINKTLAEIFDSKNISRITQYYRSGSDYDKIYENALINGEWENKDRPRYIFDKFSKKGLTQDELLYAQSLWQKIIELARERNGENNYVESLEGYAEIIDKKLREEPVDFDVR